MIDYKGIEALYTTILMNSFEMAAKKLSITQSAISQRIKNLENHYGEPLLSRTMPYKPTRLGELLIQHFKKVDLLETSFLQTIHNKIDTPTFTIALNRDSMETWFLSLLHKKKFTENISLEIITDDQEQTIHYLKNGVASASISTSSKKIIGADAHYLGEMEYVLVSTPLYKKQYLNNDIRSFFSKSTALKYDHNDHLHQKYLNKYFNNEMENIEIKYHILPSVLAFKQYTLQSNCYALLPKIDILKELNQGTLIQLFPDKTWKIPLYLHYWNNFSNPLFEKHQFLIQFAQKALSS